MDTATIYPRVGRLVNDRARELNGTTTALLVLATVFVGLRFWARHMRLGIGPDDWMTVAALVSSNNEASMARQLLTVCRWLFT